VATQGRNPEYSNTKSFYICISCQIKTAVLTSLTFLHPLSTKEESQNDMFGSVA
jgi:hypothetical protein